MTRHQPRSAMTSETLERKRARDRARKPTNATRKRRVSADVSPDRTCSVCGGKLSARNKSGICAKTYECRVEQQLKRYGGERKRPKRGESMWTLPPAYEIDEDGNRLLDENDQPIEIVDEIAISIAVSGVRRVPLTERERRMAIETMIKTGWQYREIADHIGTSPAKLKPIIEELGYRLIPRRQPGSTPREATEIRKI